jgi:DNA-binding CsgD family transcriptional regulator
MALEDGELDPVTCAALARLTEREKDCLRRRLLHQTAKEMALELGVSPHAVEKRLKTARAKLGVGSSLEAARSLAALEEYQRMGSQASDLAAAAPAAHKRPTKAIVLGGIAMSLSAAILIFVAAQASSSGEVAASPAANPAPIAETYPPSDFVKATPAEILVIVQTTFHTFDKDHSGFLEGDESPMVEPAGGSPVYRLDKDGKPVPTGQVVHRTLAELRKIFYTQADSNRDGKVSFEEYRRWDSPSLARQGIPAEWKADINRPVSTDLPSSPDPG